jgi:hypothetical protein
MPAQGHEEKAQQREKRHHGFDGTPAQRSDHGGIVAGGVPLVEIVWVE